MGAQAQTKPQGLKSLPTVVEHPSAPSAERVEVGQRIRELLKAESPDYRAVLRLMALHTELVSDEFSGTDPKRATLIGSLHSMTASFLRERETAVTSGIGVQDDGWEKAASLLVDDVPTEVPDPVEDETSLTGELTGELTVDSCEVVKRERSVSPAQVREVITLVRSGMSKSKVARRLGISRQYVYDLSNKHIRDGVPLP